jgi:hypothetical protein
MGGKIFQQTEFTHGGQHSASFDANGHRGGIYFEITETQDFWWWRIPNGSQDSTHTGDELARTEGFGDVVVATKFQTAYSIRFFGPGCQKYDRGLGKCFVLAYLAAEIKTVDAREHDIEQKKRRPLPQRIG